MEGYVIGQVGHASLGQNVVVSVVTSVAYFKERAKRFADGYGIWTGGIKDDSTSNIKETVEETVKGLGN